MPQPYLVPVRLRLSRRIQSSGVSPGTFAAISTRCLLTKMVGMRSLESRREAARAAKSSMIGDCGEAFDPSCNHGGAARSLRYNFRLPRHRQAMEAEQLNQLENTIADLRERASGLRRYL